MSSINVINFVQYIVAHHIILKLNFEKLMSYNFFKLLERIHILMYVHSVCIRKYMQMIYFSSELWQRLSCCVKVSLQ